MSIKVLFAEDDRNIGGLTAQYLESEGFEVRLCASGGTVLAEFEKFKPDIYMLLKI